MTAGFETMNFSSTCGQLVQSISPAQAGRGARSTRRIRSPRWNGRLQITAILRSIASGRIRCSTSRSTAL